MFTQQTKAKLVVHHVTSPSVHLSQNGQRTSLSAHVYSIICKTVSSAEESNVACLDSCGLLDWYQVSGLLPASTRPEDENYDYFIDCVQKLSPVLKALHDYMCKLSADQFAVKYGKYLTWTKAPQLLQQCFETLQTDKVHGPLESLLLSVPVLERSLGDVYLLKGHHCPSMIKELLVTKELLDIFGQTPIHVLRIMIGPPISLNLRNVTWHGFPAPSEIHPQYPLAMLCITASLGKLLEDKHIEISSIPHRQSVRFPQIQHLIEIGLPDLRFDVLHKWIDNSSFIQPNMRSIWHHSANHHVNKRYYECVSLMLPQLEHGMRRLFAEANHCPQRVLTAENTVLFTTFDEILSPSLEDGSENKLRYFVGDSLISMLLDLLLYPDGPRLRDRMSHGETGVECLTVDTSYVVLYVCFYCAAKCLSEKDPTRQDPVIAKLLAFGDDYQSVFHPISIIKRKIKDCVDSLQNWKSLPRPDADQIGSQIDWNTDGNVHVLYQLDPDLLEATQHYVQSFVGARDIDVRLLHPFSDLEPLISHYLCDDIPTLYRSSSSQQKASREDEILGLVRKIIQSSLQISKQVVGNAVDRHTQYKQKELRSRQRKTYARMLDSIPRISCGLCVLLIVCAAHVNCLDTMSRHVQASFVKVLKSLLQYTENLQTYTHDDKNRWEEAVTLTDNLKDRLKVCNK